MLLRLILKMSLEGHDLVACRRVAEAVIVLKDKLNCVLLGFCV